MVVMFDVTAPVGGTHAMTKGQSKAGRLDWKALLLEDEDRLKGLLHAVVQEVLEAEMTEAVGAEKGERTPGRLGYRSGYYERKLVTRVGVSGDT